MAKRCRCVNLSASSGHKNENDFFPVFLFPRNPLVRADKTRRRRRRCVPLRWERSQGFPFFSSYVCRNLHRCSDLFQRFRHEQQQWRRDRTGRANADIGLRAATTNRTTATSSMLGWARALAARARRRARANTAWEGVRCSNASRSPGPLCMSFRMLYIHCGYKLLFAAATATATATSG